MGLRSLTLAIDPITEMPTGKTRNVGLVVLRGPQIFLVGPEDGFEEIANPFLQQE